MNYSNHPGNKEYRQLLRKTRTPMEVKLWKHLCKRQVDGYKFRQQHGFGPYVLDFYCPELRLCIELDGEVHNTPEAKQKDSERTEFLNNNKIRVVRFRNEEVEENVENVIKCIRMNIKEINEIRGLHDAGSDPQPHNLGGKVKWKMVVLDDDPTGIQTVHGCLLITRWDEESVRLGFQDSEPFFYILTNTRAMTREDAAQVTREAMEMVVKVNQDYGYHLIIVSRSDSCLRGHFPLETDVMRQCLVEHGYSVYEKTPFCPAFIEAGRVTIDGIHYMRDGKQLIPVSQTEFARDNVFAYHTSILTEYIKEKGANPEDYEIVNAESYDELYRFARHLTSDILAPTSSLIPQPSALSLHPSAIVIRSSSSLPKAISGISDIPLLDRTILTPPTSSISPQPSSISHQPSALSPLNPGCFVVGSHVKKTTLQLEQLLQAEGTCAIEVDVQRILDDSALLMSETLDTIRQVVEIGLTPVVYTSRQEIRLDDANQRQHLGQQVSDFLVDIVYRLPFTPSYLVGKGGITSHDILTKGLGIRSARVLGQVIASVPCVMAPHFPYIIFPGNVGNEQSLRAVYLKLR